MQPEAPPIKAQSAIEYLSTYSWAILILAIVIAVLIGFGAYSASSYVSTVCSLPQQLSCIGVSFAASNGNILLNIGQSAASMISITAAGCNTNGTVSHMYTTNDLPENVVYGSNNTVLTQCFENGSISTRKIGNIFNGYVIINYTNLNSGVAHTAVGKVVVKATALQVLTTTSTTTM